MRRARTRETIATSSMKARSRVGKVLGEDLARNEAAPHRLPARREGGTSRTDGRTTAALVLLPRRRLRFSPAPGLRFAVRLGEGAGDGPAASRLTAFIRMTGTPRSRRASHSGLMAAQVCRSRSEGR